jgi:hypothetical protein
MPCVETCSQAECAVSQHCLWLLCCHICSCVQCNSAGNTAGLFGPWLLGVVVGRACPYNAAFYIVGGFLLQRRGQNSKQKRKPKALARIASGRGKALVRMASGRGKPKLRTTVMQVASVYSSSRTTPCTATAPLFILAVSCFILKHCWSPDEAVEEHNQTQHNNWTQHHN